MNMAENNNFKQIDRDLLIEIKTKLDRAINDINELKDNTAHRVDNLENTKLEKNEFYRIQSEMNLIDKDFELRLRRLERYGSIAIGFLILLEFLFKFIVS